LFCKIYDEITTGPEEIVSFRSGIDESPESVSDRLKRLFEKVKSEYSDIFDDGDSINLDSTSINYVVGELQNYCVTEAERDVLGDAFEVFIGPALKGGQGQFFTPRNVVRLAIGILDPKPGDFIIDPACGSGGFLVVVVEYIWNKIREEAHQRGFDRNWIKDKQRQVANRYIRGIDKDSFLAKVTKAYMAIIGDGRGGVFCENSLEPTESYQDKTREKISLDSFDVLLTNPPFGSKIPIREQEILEQFTLGHTFRKQQKGLRWEQKPELQNQQPPQILFIERCIEFLKPGGKMAIVLPDGVLGGSRVGYIPHFIRQKAKVLALIDCPKETFQPFVSTKTHLVFLQKKTQAEIGADDSYEVFMAIANYVGHDRKGKPLFEERDGVFVERDDLSRIAEKYRVYQDRGLAKKDFDRFGFVVSSRWLENYLVSKRYLPKFTDALEELEQLQKRGQFKLRTIGEIKRRLFTGANVNAEEYLDNSPYRYLMTACITEYGINPAKYKYIGEKPYQDNATKVIQTDDIVINRAGQSGIATIFPKDMEGVLACGFAFVLRLKESYNPYYVAAFLNSRLGRLQMERYAFGSILDHITKDDLENVIIPFPEDENLLNSTADEFREIVEAQMNARLNFNSFFDAFEQSVIESG
jgi:type I restriction enzyme M protein